MTDWRKVKAPEGGRPGLVEPVKHYALKPGMAVVYNEERIHSPDRAGPTRLIRTEGRHLDGVPRDRYPPADQSDAAELRQAGGEGVSFRPPTWTPPCTDG